MDEITSKEAEFLIELLEQNKSRYSNGEVVLKNDRRTIKLHNVDIYFLQQKLLKI